MRVGLRPDVAGATLLATLMVIDKKSSWGCRLGALLGFVLLGQVTVLTARA